MLCRVAFGAVALGLVISFSQTAIGQPPPGGTAAKVNGKVAQVVPQGLMVKGSDGKEYAVMLDQKSQVSLLGTAGPDFLIAKTFVQLDAELDDKGVPTKEVDKIQIVEPSAINQPGVFSEAGPDAKPGAAGKYFIRGTVKSYKEATLILMAGPKPMTFKVSAAAAVPVTNGEWGLAMVGDAVTGDAMSYPVQGTVTPMYGSKIEIKAVLPITRKKKGKK